MASFVMFHETQVSRPVPPSAQLWHAHNRASPWLVSLVFRQVVVLVLILIARVGRNET